MIKNKLSLALIAILIAGTTVVTSCKKKTTTPEPEPTKDSDLAGATDNSLSENSSSDMEAMGSEACDLQGNGSLGTYRPSSESLLNCATVTRDSANKTVTVSFDGVTACKDGKVRAGSIIYNYSASTNGAKRYRHPGFNLSITTNNYAVDGNTITITNKTISNTTPINFTPSITAMTWSISANITITKPGGGTVAWVCNRVKTLINTSSTYLGVNTPIAWANARVGITGSASGTRQPSGEGFSVVINSQLVRDFGTCHPGIAKKPFIQGILVYTPSGKSSRTFDYGDGTCNDIATVSIDNVTYTITLP